MRSLPQNHGTVTIQINVRGAYCWHGGDGRCGWPRTGRRGGGVPGRGAGHPSGCSPGWRCWAASPRPSRGSCAPSSYHCPRGVSPHPAACSPGPRSSSQPPPPRWTSPFFPALSPASASRRARGTLCVHGCARVACGVRACPVETRNPGSRKRRIRGPSPARPLHLFQRRSFAVRCTSASWAARQAEPQSARPRVRTCAQARGSCRTWACGAPRDAVARSRPAVVRVSGSFPPAGVHVRACVLPSGSQVTC